MAFPLATDPQCTRTPRADAIPGFLGLDATVIVTVTVTVRGADGEAAPPASEARYGPARLARGESIEESYTWRGGGDICWECTYNETFMLNL